MGSFLASCVPLRAVPFHTHATLFRASCLVGRHRLLQVKVRFHLTSFFIVTYEEIKFASLEINSNP